MPLKILKVAEKVLPCPRCSSPVRIYGNGKVCLISCRCGITSRSFDDTDRLIRWWNTRNGPAPAEVEHEVDEEAGTAEPPAEDSPRARKKGGAKDAPPEA